MPIYAHSCSAHGEFDDIRPYSRSGEDAPCPICTQACGRIVTMPQFKTMDRGQRLAHERNEKSRHEPHVCTSGCSHQHTKKPALKPGKAEVYKGPRPWVIEHGCT